MADTYVILNGIIDNNTELNTNDWYIYGGINLNDFDSGTFAYSDFWNYLLGVEGTCLNSSDMDVLNLVSSEWDLRVVRPFIDIQTTKFVFDVNGVQRRPDKKLADYVPDYFPTYDDVDRKEYTPELAPGKEDEC